VTGVSQIFDPGHAYRFFDGPGTWGGATLRDDVHQLGWMACNVVTPGMSGAPVRRRSDDVVVGVVSGRYNSADDWLRDCVWVARCERLQALCSDVAPATASPMRTCFMRSDMRLPTKDTGEGPTDSRASGSRATCSRSSRRRRARATGS